MNFRLLGRKYQLIYDIDSIWVGILIGVVFSVSRLIDSLWFLSFLGIFLFLFVIKNKQSKVSIFSILFLTIFTYNLLGLVWFWGAYPLDWIVGVWWFAILLVFIAWLFTAFFLSIGAVAFIPWLFVWQYSKVWASLSLPFFWLLYEYFGQWIFSILTYGQGNLLGAHFSVNMLGYTLASHPGLLQLAAFGDVYILSIIVVIGGCILYTLCEFLKENKSKILVLFSAVFILIITAYLSDLFIKQYDYKKNSEEQLTVGLVYTDFKKDDPQNLVDKHNVIKDIILSHDTKDLDIFILPESINFTQLSDWEKEDKKGWLANQFSEESVLIESGLVGGSTQEDSVSLGAYGTRVADLSVVQIYDKKLLVPMGEYIPNIVFKVIKFIGLRDIFTASRSQINELNPGNNYPEIIIKNTSLTVRFCSEVISPSIYEENSQDTKILINLSSHAFFGGTKLLHPYLVDVAKVRAVSSRSYYLQASNSSPAFVVDPTGQIKAESEIGKGLLKISVFP